MTFDEWKEKVEAVGLEAIQGVLNSETVWMINYKRTWLLSLSEVNFAIHTAAYPGAGITRHAIDEKAIELARWMADRIEGKEPAKAEAEYDEERRILSRTLQRDDTESRCAKEQ